MKNKINLKSHDSENTIVKFCSICFKTLFYAIFLTLSSFYIYSSVFLSTCHYFVRLSMTVLECINLVYFFSFMIKKSSSEESLKGQVKEINHWIDVLQVMKEN